MLPQVLNCGLRVHDTYGLCFIAISSAAWVSFVDGVHDAYGLSFIAISFAPWVSFVGGLYDIYGLHGFIFFMECLNRPCNAMREVYVPNLYLCGAGK